MKKTLFVVMLNLIVIGGLIISPLPLVSDIGPMNQSSIPADRSDGVSSDRLASYASNSPLPVRTAAPSISAQPVTATKSDTPPAAPAALSDSAYTKNIDLGARQHAALVASSPINYQASDGSWQPIDPRFEAAAGGFMNRRNSLVIGAAHQQAILHLANGKNAITWVPQAIMTASADKHEAVIATSLPLAQSALGALTQNDRTIVYPHSWTLPDLSTVVTAGAGRVEQNLILAQRPTFTDTLSTRTVVLRSDLYLMPGAQLYGDGRLGAGSATQTFSVPYALYLPIVLRGF